MLFVYDIIRMKLMLGGRRMDIGSKIKKSRTDAKITQEQAAEALDISRQKSEAKRS